MSPMMKTEMVRVTYWACADPVHRHKTAATAAVCIARQERKKTNPSHWGVNGRAQVLAQFRAGMRQAELALQMGLSRSRVGQIIKQAERREKYLANRLAADASLVDAMGKKPQEFDASLSLREKWPEAFRAR